jgi:hypothetical protein
MQELPTVDLADFHSFRLNPNQSYISLAPETQEEDDRLKALLNVDKLIQPVSKKLERPKPGAVVVIGQLHPVAQTESGQLVAVALQLAYATKGAQDGLWVAFIVDPDDYKELQADVEAKVRAYRKNIENIVRGMEKKN